MQKFVQQFRSSKELRSNPISVESEMAFPYELFMDLYCYDKVKLFPFGLTNYGDSCYKEKEGNSPLSLIGILSKIHEIRSHLGHGREEDAHEFLRCVVDTMQSIFLKEAGVSSLLAEETTMLVTLSEVIYDPR
ncbi:hypothetical protein VNO77_38995 [Canavalia gladiata]|uniref:Uncharacterized protein n=1 Tax=Canavalia gladiata TaxID=3824 RepID=A0AAN9KDL8_CANGL